MHADARAETRFHFRTGIASVVPWLVVSDCSSDWPIRATSRCDCLWVQAATRGSRSIGPSGLLRAFRDAHPALGAYFDRVLTRSSVARVVEEARPYRELFPLPWPEHVS